AEDGIRDDLVTGVQTCALPISAAAGSVSREMTEPPPRAHLWAWRNEPLRARPRWSQGWVTALGCAVITFGIGGAARAARQPGEEIGRASCRERGRKSGAAV